MLSVLILVKSFIANAKKVLEGTDRNVQVLFCCFAEYLITKTNKNSLKSNF